jgi:transposase
VPTTPPKKKKAGKKKTAKANTSKSLAPKKMGRPTKYRPEYCQMLIDHMASGYPFETFAAVVDSTRSTLYLWEKANVDFMDAKKKGQEKLYQYLLKIGYKISLGGGGNPTAWIFMMKNICGWRNEVAVKHDVTVSPHQMLVELAEKAEQNGDIIDIEETEE